MTNAPAPLPAPVRRPPPFARPLRVAGLLGPAIMVAGVVVPAVAYVGRAGQPYSPLNHFISELGEIGVSPLAWVFNASLFVSGLLMAAFLGVLGWRLGSRTGKLAAVAGVVAGLGASAVGLTPMNDLVPHLRMAFTFFWGGLAAVALFTSAVLRDGGRHLPRWLAGPGVVAIVAFAAFLAWPFYDGPPDTRMLDPISGVPRPAVWMHTVLEWAVLVSVLAFIVCGGVAWRSGGTGLPPGIRLPPRKDSGGSRPPGT